MTNKFIYFAIAVSLLTVFFCSAIAESVMPLKPVVDRKDSRTLICGWYPWDPYQYIAEINGERKLTGLDVQLMKEIFGNAGYKVQYKEVDWDVHQRDLAEGRRDIAAGAFYTTDRAKYAYYSKPYRNEVNVFYVRSGESNKIPFNNEDEMIRLLKQKKIKIGIVKGYKYASDKLNTLIHNPKYKDIFVSGNTVTQNFKDLFSKKTIGFFADRLVGATISWRNKWFDKVEIHPGFSAKKDIYVIFSKKTTTPELVKKFNNSLRKLRESRRYKQIVMDYVYPILLAITVQKDWFFAIDIIGTVAFALSGVLLAHRENYSVVGAAVLAVLPAAGGGIFRDLILGRGPVGFLKTTTYVFTVGLVLIISYLLIRFYRIGAHFSERLKKMGDKTHFVSLRIHGVNILDSLGLSAFTVIGVVITVTARLHPLLVWGPIFAVITSIGGGIVRDLVRNDPVIHFLKGELYAELSAIWAFLLCLYLNFQIYNLNPEAMFLAVLATLFGCFICRVFVVYYKISSIRF